VGTFMCLSGTTRGVSSLLCACTIGRSTRAVRRWSSSFTGTDTRPPPYAMSTASVKGHLTILMMWLVAHARRVDRNMCITHATTLGHRHIVKWLYMLAT